MLLGLAGPRCIVASKSMAYERTARRRHRRSAVGRAWLYCLWLSTPGLVFAGILIAREGITFTPGLLIICCLLLYLLLIAAALIESFVRPMQTLSNVVASMREGDFSFRARGAGTRDSFGELAGEINALADLLQRQRVRSLEATALLGRILEVMHAPLFAFDRQNVLQLVNTAGTRMLDRSHARCFGYSAAALGLEDLLHAVDGSIHRSAGSRRAGCCAGRRSGRRARRTRCWCWRT